MPDVIDSIKHPVVVAARESTGESGAASFLIEGPKLVLEAIAAGAPLERVFFTHPLAGADEEAAWEAAAGAGIECRLVTRGVLFRILGLGYETATRVLATVKITRRTVPELLAGVGPDTYLLVGERIQDPRNVGVLIRTADAWGLKAVAFTQGSADPFSRAGVRSSTGSILRVGVTEGVSAGELLEGLKEKGVRIVGASAGADTVCWEVDLSPPWALVVGNETAGLSAEAREECDLVARIPMYGGAHSFNVTVAAGILLYEAARQRETGR